MKKVLITVAGALVLAGCVSPTQRIANCTASGVSYDTCYLSEQQRQQRQQSINNASLSAAYANAARATETNKHTHHN
ncbi:hypothetical protein EKN38_00485 [Enterobacter sp. WCHEn045836]|nr:hypothetical protein EKN38_00485 [Enterobacter sp. WCHEn045836]